MLRCARGVDLEDHRIVVGRRVDRGDLAGAEGAVQAAADLVGRDAHGRRLLPVDREESLQVLGLRGPEVTSWKPGSCFSLASTSGAQWFSSARSDPRSVY